LLREAALPGERLARFLPLLGGAGNAFKAAKAKNVGFVKRVERLAAVSCDKLFKRKPCLLGFYAGFVRGTLEPLVFLSR
jgi:hypothetical protein